MRWATGKASSSTTGVTMALIMSVLPMTSR